MGVQLVVDNITMYLTTLLRGVESLPLEYRKFFVESETDLGWNLDISPIKRAKANARSVVTGANVTLAVIGQVIEKAAVAAPPNFVAFLQGASDSRFAPKDMLMSIAYLQTRKADLPRSVQKQISANLAAWFTGVGLSKAGDIAEGGNVKTARECALGGLAHGAALELVGTTLYDAIYNIGSKINVPNAAEYEILFADPQGNDKIQIPFMRKENQNFEHQPASPHERRPDLILAGSGDAETTWIEFKSYQFDSSLRINSGKLDESKWAGEIKSSWLSQRISKITGKRIKTGLRKYANAHRQAALDYTATTDPLSNFWWKKKDFLKSKPLKTITWLQVWREEKSDEKWKKLVLNKKTGRYQFQNAPASERKIPDKPWIGYDDGTKINGINDKGIVTKITPEFQEFQRHLGAIPTKFDTENPRSKVTDVTVWETSTGLTAEDYYKNIKVVSATTEDASDVKVRPFTIPNFFKVTAKDASMDAFFNELDEKFGETPYLKLYEQLQNGVYSEADVAQLRENLREEMLKILGPVEYIAKINEWNPTKYVQDIAGDYVLADQIEAVREYAAKYEPPEWVFGDTCEDLQ